MLVGNEVDIVEEVRKATGDPLSACLLCIILLCEKAKAMCFHMYCALLAWTCFHGLNSVGRHLVLICRWWDGLGCPEPDWWYDSRSSCWLLMMMHISVCLPSQLAKECAYAEVPPQSAHLSLLQTQGAEGCHRCRAAVKGIPILCAHPRHCGGVLPGRG